MNLLRKIIAFPFILLVRIYQYVISPLTPQSCRHEPTCSTYTVQAIEEWGPLKGMWLGMKRLSKCHPWGTWGYDPVPKNPKRKHREEKKNT